jgi:hypothetical protein
VELLSAQDRGGLSGETLQARLGRTDLGATDDQISELKNIRRREKLARVLRTLSAPIASAVAGVVVGGALGYEMDQPATPTTYPYAVMAGALLPAGSLAHSRRSLLISVATITFVFGFLAGIALGDSLNDVDQFSYSVRYGVARDEGM